jgi:hypothetical protein
VDYAAESVRHKYMAEEFRTMADLTPHPALRAIYLDAAEVYDRLAANEAMVAQNLKKAN